MERNGNDRTRGNLVLTRRVGESVLIGEDIRVTIADMCRGKIRLVITAPRDVLVLRAELVKGAGE